MQPHDQGPADPFTAIATTALLRELSDVNEDSQGTHRASAIESLAESGWEAIPPDDDAWEAIHGLISDRDRFDLPAFQAALDFASRLIVAASNMRASHLDDENGVSYRAVVELNAMPSELADLVESIKATVAAPAHAC